MRSEEASPTEQPGTSCHRLNGTVPLIPCPFWSLQCQVCACVGHVWERGSKARPDGGVEVRYT